MQKLNRSFSRRIGKTLSNLQNNAIDNLLPNLLLDPKNLPSSDITAEIGIGMGEHFINMAKNNQNAVHIGFEPYLNGIANALLLSEKENISNIRLWPDDVDLIFTNLPDNSINKLYVLFPDPWPKTKQKKRRILCKDRLEIIFPKLTKDAIIYFASDIDDYSNEVLKTFELLDNFELISNPNNIPHKGYVQTKYHSKAIKEGRLAKFFSWKILPQINDN